MPLAPLLLFCSLWFSAWFAAWLTRRLASAEDSTRHSAAAGDALWQAAMIGLLAARLAHLAFNLEAYTSTPWAMLDIRDGGWHALSGALAGAAWLSFRSQRLPLLRRPLAVAALAGASLWLLGNLALGVRNAPPLPAIQVTDLATGVSAPLPEFARGRPVVLNLWASWCGPCRQEMPMLAQAQQREPNLAFLFINQGESMDAVRAYLEREHLPLREVLLDSGSQALKALGSNGLPTTVFFDASGHQIDAHFGVLNAAALATRLRALHNP